MANDSDHASHVLLGGEGSYAVLDVIGRGAYGIVYKGIWRENGHHVAIKRVSRTRLSPDENKALQGEILLFKKLNHAHIVNYIEAVDDPLSPYLDIVMEFVEGGSLFNMVQSIKRSRDIGKPVFDEPVVADFVRQVVLGLSYLHQQGVVHRDIKGANILITKQGHCKLADFGVSSTKPADNSSSPAFDVAGSPYWMAPEIINLTGSSTASDIWSLGCTVIELLTGHPPYHQYADVTALFKIVSDERPPLPPNLTSECEDFLRLCFNKDADSRATADELLSHRWLLHGNNTNHDSSSPSPVSSPSASPPPPVPENQEASLNMFKEDVDDYFDDIDFDATTDGSDRLASLSAPGSVENAPFDGHSTSPPVFSPPIDALPFPDRSEPVIANSTPSPSRLISRSMRSVSFRDDPFKDVLEDPEVDRERERLRRQKELWQLMKMHVASLGKDVAEHVSACDALIDLFKRSPEQRYYLIYDPGLLPILEVLESDEETDPRVIEAMLRVTLSFVGDEDARHSSNEDDATETDGFGKSTGEMAAFGYPRVSNIREDLCLAGFLPVVMRFCRRTVSFEARLLAARFLEKMIELERVMRMFIACRGFSVFVDMLEPDVTMAGDLCRIALAGIDRLLSMDNQRHKRDFCRRFSFIGLLDRIVEGISFNMQRVDDSSDTSGAENSDCASLKTEKCLEHVSKLASLLQTFAARVDARVKAKMTNGVVLEEIIKQVGNENAPQAAVLSILCCIRDLSRDPQTHAALQEASTIEALIRCLSEERGRESNAEHFIISSLHNLCIVSPVRQELAAGAGVVPHLRRYIVSKDMNVRSLCIDMYSGLACAGPAARVELGKDGGVDFYVDLMVMLCGPGTVRKWQARVLQSLVEWLEDGTQMEMVERRLIAEENRTRVCESLAQMRLSELGGVLEPYLRMITVSDRVNAVFGASKELVVTIVRWLEEMYGQGSGSGGWISGGGGGRARGRLLVLRTLLGHCRKWKEGSVHHGIISGLRVLVTEVVLPGEEAITVREQAMRLLSAIDSLP